jgi:DNA-binding MarR family transcriptional regulator
MQLLMLKDLPRFECLLEAGQSFPDLDPTAFDAFLHLLYAGDSIVTAMAAHFHEQAISRGRFVVLMLLFKHQRESCCRPSAPLTPAQLADQSGVTRATMTGLIDTLERDGLVLREPSKEDRRMMQVALTRKGEALLKDFLPVHFRRIAALMGALTQDEQKLMVQLTQKIVARTREVQSAMAEGNA